MNDPVSWFVIEAGWHVVGSDGRELGKVAQVVGDSDKDIFNGLSVSHGLLRPKRYVPSERVTTITEGRVELDLDADAFGRLGDYDETPRSETGRSDISDTAN
jgi:sporulation protein YlmC with PRC-barrel domain